MENTSFGFIGGGRITRILLHGWIRARMLPERIVVTDSNPDVLKHLKKEFPGIETVVSDPMLPAKCDLVFIALHPPAVADMLQTIKAAVNPSAIVISLVPRIRINKIAEVLPQCANIVRINPNAPSIVNEGFNPLAFSDSIGPAEKRTVLDLFEALGKSPEIPEELLEAFAIITAMGPTYLWFQLYELQTLAESFAIPTEIIKEALPQMLHGAVKTMFDSTLAPEEVMDLVPVKPLCEDEQAIKEIYRNRLSALYNKLQVPV